MAWTGDLQMSDEYLFGRAYVDEDKYPDRTSFLEASAIYRPYFAPFFACIVLIQLFLGWNFGIHLLCYLLFYLCTVRFPESQAGLHRK